jgi:hypothetical protein
MKFNLKNTTIGSIVAVDKEAEVRIKAAIDVKGRTSASSIVLIRDLDFEKVDSIWAKFFMHFFVIKLAVVYMKIKKTHFSLEKHF